MDTVTKLRHKNRIEMAMYSVILEFTLCFCSAFVYINHQYGHGEPIVVDADTYNTGQKITKELDNLRTLLAKCYF